jgi:hypothetical protein
MDRNLRKSRRSRLEVYLAAGSGAVLLAGSSEGAVVSIDLSSLNAITPGQTLQVNNFAGGVDTMYARLRGPGQGVTGFTSSGSQNGAAYIGFRYGTTVVKFLTGQSIGPSTNSGFNWGGGLYNSAFRDPYVSGPNFGAGEFVGFKTTEGRYGYIEVTWTNDGPFNIIRAAYESDIGVAILAGAQPSGAVPEPASSAVVALLVGGTALRQWRKKRREAEPTNSDSLAS